MVRPAINRLEKIGQWEGFTHQASLIYWNEATDMQLLISPLRALLKEQTGIAAGITLLPANGLLVRVLGNKAEAMHNLFKEIGFFISNGKPPNVIGKTGNFPMKTGVQEVTPT